MDDLGSNFPLDNVLLLIPGAKLSQKIDKYEVKDGKLWLFLYEDLTETGFFSVILIDGDHLQVDPGKLTTSTCEI